ncbi:MAG: COX15/CtaA family protein [Pseudomonadota bacterium]
MSKRSIFEEVSAQGSAAAVAHAAKPVERVVSRAGIAAWLWLLAALVAIMVLVGGATRLTDSGLSITEWAPVMGSVPPLSAADWEAAFAAYKTTTEYQQQNNWMSLADFKPIYWWEWGHRLLGRLIGLVWFLGFAWFLVRNRIPNGWTGRLLLLGVLGGLQGAVGWWMVASGLTGRLDVAPYRLASHLGLAFVIFAAITWFALKIRMDEIETLKARRQRLGGLMGLAGALVVLVFVQVLSGALVAGLDAGQGYIDWPLMAGQVFPAEAFDLEPWWINFFENPALTQFNHRVLAYLTVVFVVIFLVIGLRSAHRASRRWVLMSGAMVLVQATLGVVTLIHAAPVHMAIVHQGVGLALFFVLLRTRFEAAYPSEQSVRG